MKRIHKILGISTAIVMLVGVCAVVIAATSSPGSEYEPVVTKSYVDSKLAASGGGYVPIEVKQGNKVIGGEGTEMILRSGEATAIGTTTNGVSDLTGGADLASGDEVALNHLLLIPRDDGRGILAKTDGYVMIRGEYEIK